MRLLGQPLTRRVSRSSRVCRSAEPGGPERNRPAIDGISMPADAQPRSVAKSSSETWTQASNADTGATITDGTLNSGGTTPTTRTGVTATHVPYRGIGQSFTDMMANKIQFAFSSVAGALPFTADNRLRPLAVTSMKRTATYPDLPTVDEGGLKGFDVDLWYGMFAPAAVPPDVMAKLNAALKEALANPELKAAFAKVSAEPRYTTSQDGTAFLHSEFDKWKKVITDGDIKEN